MKVRTPERLVLYSLGMGARLVAYSSILWIVPLLDHIFGIGYWGLVVYLVGAPLAWWLGGVFLRASSRSSA